MSNSDNLQKLGERFNELRNKQASLKGIIESREKERDSLKQKLIESGFAEEDLTEEKAKELSSNLGNMLADFESKLDSWEEELRKAKEKLL